MEVAVEGVGEGGAGGVEIAHDAYHGQDCGEGIGGRGAEGDVHDHGVVDDAVYDLEVVATFEGGSLEYCSPFFI